MKKSITFAAIIFLLLPITLNAATSSFRSSPRISSPRISTPRVSTPRISTSKVNTPKISAPKTSRSSSRSFSTTREPGGSYYQPSSGSFINSAMWFYILSSNHGDRAKDAKTEEEIKDIGRTVCTEKYDKDNCERLCTDEKEIDKINKSFFKNIVTIEVKNACTNETSSKTKETWTMFWIK